jgi:hypothetical protein
MARQLFTAEDLNTLGRLFTEAKVKLLGVVLPELPPTLSAKRPKPIKSFKAAPLSEAAPPADSSIGLGIGSLKG